ncbi:MAG TPA: DCC1-like thiol-disulfide oxidoreductase family protein [Polyangiales bacterium]|nr:DCC1-like thiol-disulfide oxidoreductase family protein [Polyangiales bacterium]
MSALLLFDGVCNVCNAIVLFVVDRDPKEHFQFASLQSELGERTLREHGLPMDLNTVVLIEDGKAYVRSSAALRVARGLRWPWPALYTLMLIPRSLRDALYTSFASRRYKLFGKSEQCRIPTPELRRRMLA